VLLGSCVLRVVGVDFFLLPPPPADQIQRFHPAAAAEVARRPCLWRRRGARSTASGSSCRPSSSRPSSTSCSRPRPLPPSSASPLPGTRLAPSRAPRSVYNVLAHFISRIRFVAESCLLLARGSYGRSGGWSSGDRADGGRRHRRLVSPRLLLFFASFLGGGRWGGAMGGARSRMMDQVLDETDCC